MKNLIAALAICFASACSLITVRPSNFPFFGGTYYQVVNRGTYPVVFALNGCQIGKNPSDWIVEPGELTAFRLSNWSGTGAQFTVNYRRVDNTGAVVGAANDDSLWMWGENRRSEAVILTDEGVTRCGSIICRWQ